jgi:chromosome partitioning protein
MALVMCTNIKGGSGKTTAALVYALEMARHGTRVILFEGDPNQPLTRWAMNRGAPVIIGADERPKKTAECARAIAAAGADGAPIMVVHDPDEERVFDWIEAATASVPIVIADPEGSPNQWLQDVALHADLVIIPFAPTALDAHQVSRTVTLLGRVGRRTGRPVLYRILLTRCGAIQTRDERKIRAALTEGGMPVLATTLRDRPAFRAVFDLDATLEELQPETINGLEGARANATEFAHEVIALLKSAQEGEAA